MGRKIRGKKHRGVKDPRKQAADRLANIANKINRPPSNDDQEISKSVLRIKQFQEKVKIKKKKQKKQRSFPSTVDFMPKEVEQYGMTRPVKPPPVITLLPGENKKQFLRRIDQACKESLREALFEEEFKVEVKRDSSTGKVIDVVKEKKNEVHKIIEEAEASKQKKNKKRKKGVVLCKSEKRRAKIVAKTEMKNERESGRDFSDYKDEVKFKEIVHQPPKFNVLPKSKAQVTSTGGKPGCKDLLLKSMLEGKVDKKRNSMELKEKKKQLPESLARKKMLEEERRRVVNLYRLMKTRNDVK